MPSCQVVAPHMTESSSCPRILLADLLGDFQSRYIVDFSPQHLERPVAVGRQIGFIIQSAMNDSFKSGRFRLHGYFKSLRPVTKA